MEKRIPRLIFAAPKSGSGKTLITCGFLEVLKRRGIRPAAFKCGPDYIDPMFHKYALGISGGNLDSFFLREEQVRELFLRQCGRYEADMAVIEGVMGYYDGLGGVLTEASSYDIGRITRTPAVLVLDCKGMSVSLAALAKGFMDFKKDSRIQGVILNRLSPLLYERIVPVLEEAGVHSFGYVPESPLFHLESRHLGLLMPNEVEKMKRLVEAMADQLESTVDMDGLIELAKCAEVLSLDVAGRPKGIAARPEERARKAEECADLIRIGVARDEAFCFYYQENLALLESMGAKLYFFSPLHDPCLPKKLDGLLLGGGYPENYARELSENRAMLDSVREACSSGKPMLAECGGFLYLHQSLEGADGKEYDMAGLIDARAYRTGKLSRFGYITLDAPDGSRIKGHEFHYWESSDPGECYEAEKPAGGKVYRCMHQRDGLLCGFPHLYYPSNPEFLRRWLEKCKERRKGTYHGK